MKWLTWQYLTSKDGVPVLVAFIGVAGALITAIVGVAATILVQVLATRATSRRETERLQFDRLRWQHEQESAEQTRFQNEKREAFFGWLKSATRFLAVLEDVAEVGLPALALISSRRIRREAEAMLRDLRSHSAAIGLLAPELSEELGALKQFVDEVEWWRLTEDQVRVKQVKRVDDLVWSVRQAMQRSLGIPLARPDTSPAEEGALTSVEEQASS